jgi:hypothetical protein
VSFDWGALDGKVIMKTVESATGCRLTHPLNLALLQPSLRNPDVISPASAQVLPFDGNKETRNAPN